MATQIVMPQMGFDMKEGTLVRWIKHEGDTVNKGEALAEIETDKAVVEVESFASGVLKRITVKEGVTVPVGEEIGVIADPGEALEGPGQAPSALEAAGPSRAPGATAAPARAEPSTRPEPAVRAAAPAEDGRVKASPLARKEAETRGIDLADINGSGPGGRITREDVVAFAGRPAVPSAAPARAAASAPPPVSVAAKAAASPQNAPIAPLADETIAFTRMRQAIANAMSRSMREIPHFYVTIEIDMTEAMKLRAQLNKALEGDIRISVNDMIVKACAMALPKHRYFNASFTEKGVQVHGQINISVAVALEDGLVAPSIPDCASKSLAEIARASAKLVERARSGVLTAAEYGGGTFSVSNMGMYNIEDFTAIITPPQAAVLAVGSVKKTPVVRDDQVKIIDAMKVTLSTDHRVADGAQAARFLGDIRAVLENPLLLVV